MIDKVDKEIDVKLKDMMLEVRTSMHNWVEQRTTEMGSLRDLMILL